MKINTKVYYRLEVLGFPNRHQGFQNSVKGQGNTNIAKVWGGGFFIWWSEPQEERF